MTNGNYNQVEHVFYSNRSSSDSDITLDLDDFDDGGYGVNPETMSIGNLHSNRYYLWTLHHYSEPEEIIWREGAAEDEPPVIKYYWNTNGETKLNIIINGTTYTYQPKSPTSGARWLDVLLIYNNNVYIRQNFVGRGGEEDGGNNGWYNFNKDTAESTIQHFMTNSWNCEKIIPIGTNRIKSICIKFNVF